jgi:hypothetical protein
MATIIADNNRTRHHRASNFLFPGVFAPIPDLFCYN